MHACPHSTRGILANASDLLIDGLAQFVGEFDSFCTNEDVNELLSRGEKTENHHLER